MFKERAKQADQTKEVQVDEHKLMLYNDDHNTFDYVIEALIEVCDHDPVTAEQLTLIVHYKGKCAVKNGELKVLEPLCTELSNRGLTVSIK
ncbi:MAG TPA: ATP-dependent Clp protease adaptor ClpS [Bacteroidales bacterium]|nr:ATP-dependent Clp protease adaptor ClpS [Bacteroidales bacterium]